jgi:hypothetical protein
MENTFVDGANFVMSIIKDLALGDVDSTMTSNVKLMLMHSIDYMESIKDEPHALAQYISTMRSAPSFQEYYQNIAKASVTRFAELVAAKFLERASEVENDLGFKHAS